ncbi:MAG: FeoB-associated Cys-rich membrane protein [bacterium]
MSVQDLLAIVIVAGSAGYLFHKLVLQPMRSTSKASCGSGCGKCSSGQADSTNLGTREVMVTIGTRIKSDK